MFQTDFAIKVDEANNCTPSMRLAVFDMEALLACRVMAVVVLKVQPEVLERGLPWKT